MHRRELLQRSKQSTENDTPQIAKTIRTGGGRSMDKKHNWDSYPIKGRIRRLTPVECERLQAFPDRWTEKGVNEKGEEVLISDTQRYKTLGNSMTVNVLRELLSHLTI